MLIENVKPDFEFKDEQGSPVQLVREGYWQFNVITSKKGGVRAATATATTVRRSTLSRGSSDPVPSSGKSTRAMSTLLGTCSSSLQWLCTPSPALRTRFLSACTARALRRRTEARTLWR